MNSAVDSRSRPGGGRFVSFVADKFRKDFQIPGLDYQAGGIRSATLWPTAMTCLRVIPGYDPETGEVFRQNKNCQTWVKDYEPRDYITETFYEARTLSGFGERRLNVISSYRPGSPEHQRWGGDTVLSWFTSDLIHAVSNARAGKWVRMQPDPEWSIWTTYDRDRKQMPILPYDRSTLLMQALVWTLNGRPHRNRDKAPLVDANGNPLPLLYIVGIDNSNSLTEMYKALVEPQDPSSPLDGLTNNRYKGIAEKDGSLLYLLPGKVRVRDKEQNILNPHVSDNGSTWTNTPMPLSDDQIKSWWHPWDDVLAFLTPDEQLQLIADSFPDGAHLVNYWLANNTQLRGLEVPENIARVGLGKYARYAGGSVDLSRSQPVSAAPSGFGIPGLASSSPVYVPTAPAAPVAPMPSSTTGMPPVTRASAPTPPSMPAFRPVPPPASPAPAPVRPAISGNAAAEIERMRASGVSLPKPKDDLSEMASGLIGSDPDDDSPFLPFGEN